MPQSTLDLADIQGFILRGYRMPMVRHFLLTVKSPRRLASCSDGSSAATKPMRLRSRPLKTGMSGSRRDLETIPTMPPRRKPDYCLNLGITWPGLVALEIRDRVPTLSFKSFGAFVAGAAERAELVGDTGAAGRRTGSVASAREAITS